MPVNTAALKTFAPAMRRQLIEAVGRKLDLLLTSQTPDTLSTYAKQIAELREQAGESREQLLEQVAYSWFNRLAALRYLDAKGWHPFGCRVLMPAGGGETQPELLKLMRSGSLPLELKEHTNETRLNGLLDGQIPSAIAGADPQGEVYRELVLAVCHSYHHLLPNLFEGLDDATELLLPDDLLSDGSIVGAFRKEIKDDDCQDVESLGWLYQFYIAEKKDEVMARKKAVPTEDIPAVTQLFTPHWIVRYLVENSLGRLWLLNRPSSGLKAHMPYYIEGEAETDFLKINKPEEIKLLDPACGSGHMLTYAFDLLVLIYEEEGYSPNEIPGLILKHNLHGLEICPRAAQLAELALVFKAREQSRRFFQPEQLVRPQIIELQDVQFEDSELNDYIKALNLGELFDPNLFKLLHQFEEAKNFGSLIQPCLDERTIADVRSAIEAKDLGGQLFLRETHLKVLRVLEQAEALTQRYYVVVANPPYMGSRQMNGELRAFAQDRFPESKADLFSMFISRGLILTAHRGYASIITMQSWMFLSSFESFRDGLINKSSIVAMAHLGARAFDSIAGEVVQTTAFVLINEAIENLKGCYLDLIDGRNESEKKSRILQANIDPECDDIFHVSSQDLRGVPSCPIAYWISKDTREMLASSIPTLSDTLNPRQGMATGNNDLYLRLWHEISHVKMTDCASSKEEAWEASTPEVYVPYNKGGTFRKWYGNRWYVLRFSEIDYRKLKKSGNNCPSEKYYFKEGITWSDIVGITFAARHNPLGSVFDVKGSCGFPEDRRISALTLGLLNSRVTSYFKRIFNPSTTFQVGDISKIPVAIQANDLLEKNGCDCILLTQADWDNFEISWDFCDLPLLRSGDWDGESGQPAGQLKGSTLPESWANYAKYCDASIRRMQQLETENNRLWINAYGLQNELSPEVPGEEITLARADASSDMCALLSYATGCMMGRYSLDHPGLILANAGDTLENYNAKVGKPLAELTFAPDPDGIIPVLDGEWFEDDIVACSREFLAATFPESSVVDNLRFIEDSLGKDIRKYFCTDFYKDHLQTYKKRPIYWQVQSPKKGFACLIYLHRYTKDTLNLVLNNYFRPYLQKLEARLAQLGLDQLNEDLPTRDRTAARKEAEKITKVLKECQAWEQDSLLPLAQQRIELDLDDGVKVNYLKLQDVLAPIPGLAAKEEG